MLPFESHQWRSSVTPALFLVERFEVESPSICRGPVQTTGCRLEAATREAKLLSRMTGLLACSFR